MIICLEPDSMQWEKFFLRLEKQFKGIRRELGMKERVDWLAEKRPVAREAARNFYLVSHFRRDC